MRPEDALIHYTLGDIKKIKPIMVGLIHATYKIETSTGDFILQRLHPKLSHPSLTQDYAAVTAHLASKGITAQRVIKTADGNWTIPDEDALDRGWRLMTFVPGRIYETIGSARQARACAGAMAQFHAALEDFSYKFKAKLEFHPYNTPKFLNDFVRVAKKFENSPLMEPVRREVDFLLRAVPKTMPAEELPSRVVHGDLKITNFVFEENGRAVRCIIDIDTCARFPVICELGDALRSWCGRAEDDPRNKFNLALYTAAVAGYEKGAPGFLSAREKRLLPRAVKHMVLILALRFMKDYFEDSYFGWNEKKYPTRREANLARARGQLALFKDLDKKL